jgi:hypothetical protein
MVNVSCQAPTSFSVEDALTGRAKRGDIIRNHWDTGILVGVRNGRASIVWGLQNDKADRFLAACDVFDYGIPPKKQGNRFA